MPQPPSLSSSSDLTHRHQGFRRRTKIICTIGPATSSAAMLSSLARAGMDCARLNFSHGTHSEHLETIRNIRKVSSTLGKQIAILQDLPGPKFRLGDLKDGSVVLKKGSKVTLVATHEDKDDHSSSEEIRLPLRQKDLPKYVTAGSAMFFSDGSIRLTIVGTTDTEIRCVCRTGGQVFSGKGINVPSLHKDFPTFADKDKEHALFGLRNDVDFIAASFVRNASDIESVRKFVLENLPRQVEPPSIVAKIEKREALDDLEGIVRASDVVMVARGDLGVENPIEKVPLIQKRIISTCNALAVPVITATQMLESMVNNPTPTRAEVTDIANAIFDGTDALMLSEETAVGQHPVECVNILNRVALTTERKMLSSSTPWEHPMRIVDAEHRSEFDVRDATSLASYQISKNIGANLIVSPTNRGTMTAKISRFRPRAPIIALTESEKTLRKLHLLWGVYPYHVEKTKNLTELLDTSVKKLVQEGLVNDGDRIVAVCDHVEPIKTNGRITFHS